MKLKILYFFVLIIMSQNSFSQKDQTILVYMESLQFNGVFGKVGDTLFINGSDYGKDSIQTASFILKDTLGSYEGSLKYRSLNEFKKVCYQGDKKSFESMSVPVYNEKGEITGKKEMKTWKPKKISQCN